MKFSYFAVALALCGTGCASPKKPTAQLNRQKNANISLLLAARRQFKTTLLPTTESRTPVETAPAEIFRTVKYPAVSGQLAAYVSPNPNDGRKHPAIIWITGGDCNSIGNVWRAASPRNDQTAAAYRQAGIIMMFPSLRGGNQNPGRKEGFLGEVDDVVAAASWLEKQPYVDPKRIYLGGHSTGGTLAMLVAQCSNRFRATFAFGPVEDVSGYGINSGLLPFDTSNSREIELRSPAYWLSSVRSPTWVLEGTQRGNIDSLRLMQANSSNRNLHFIEVQNTDHFAILAPTNQLIAAKILKDTGPVSNVTLSASEIDPLFNR